MKSIEEILKRNARVELDKAWEVSWTRRFIITALTYVVAVTWLMVIDNEKPFLSALVPVGGYLFSTLSLPFIKVWWIQNKINHEKTDSTTGE